MYVATTYHIARTTHAPQPGARAHASFIRIHPMYSPTVPVGMYLPSLPVGSRGVGVEWLPTYRYVPVRRSTNMLGTNGILIFPA